MKRSPIGALLHTDFYKIGHKNMQEPGTEYIYSNFTPRGSRIEGVDHMVVFGIQAYIQEYLMDAFEPFFAATEEEVTNLYEKRLESILAPKEIGSDHIRLLHRKGHLPLRIKALPEGTLAPMLVPILTVENTDPDFAWLTNYIETSISRVWFPSTNATKTLAMRRKIEAWAEKTDGNKEFVDWQWHNFSARGHHSGESAAIDGAAALLSFTGTDSLEAFEWIDYFYPGDNGFIGGSVAASEHSTMVSRGQEHELETYDYLLDQFPTGILSLVSDTWDLFNVVTNILPRLYDKIVAREGKLVIRPDSGNPEDIILGTVREFGKGTTPEEKGLAELLWEEFGGTENNGFKHISPKVGMIYGDSITNERADAIFAGLAAQGFSSDNIVLGAGSWFAIGNTTRDTFNLAIKATEITVNGVAKAVKKDPITAKGTKTSATGLLAVVKDENGEFTLIQKATREQEEASELKTVWENGVFVRRQSFADVRAVLKAERARLEN